MICQITGTTMFFRLSDVPNYKYACVTISNLDVPLLTRLLNQDFGECFGRHGINQFQRLDTSMDSFFYQEFSEDYVADLEVASENFNKHADVVKQIFHSFSSYLWFVKDNSVNINALYGLAKMGTKLGQLANEYKRLSSNCTGEFKQVEFSSQELDKCVHIRSKYLELCPDHKQEDHWGYDRKVNRIEKAFKFLCAAREEMYLPAKIAFYMSMFECLFSHEAQEVTQKVCERVAFYISSDNIKRQEIFILMKDAYDMRSKYLHGAKQGSKKDKEKGKIEFQREICLKVDSIARLVFTHVILNDSIRFTNEENFDVYLRDIIFHGYSIENPKPTEEEVKIDS